MNLKSGNLSERSEKAAVKTLLEISQKENVYEIYQASSELKAWVQKDPLSVHKGNNSSNTVKRPSTALGKPPKVGKIQSLQMRQLTNRSDSDKNSQKIEKNEQNKARFEKNNQSIEKNQTTNKSLPVVSPIPPCQTVLLNFIKPPIPYKLSIRSKSLKDEEKRKEKWLSKDSFKMNKENNASFRKKMIKYKLLNGHNAATVTEALKLLNLQR